MNKKGIKKEKGEISNDSYSERKGQEESKNEESKISGTEEIDVDGG